MWPGPAAAYDALTAGVQRQRPKLELAFRTTGTGWEKRTVELLDGDVTLDGDAAVRASMRATIRLPGTDADLVDNPILAWATITVDYTATGGAPGEMVVPLGVFALDSMSTDIRTGRTTITGRDLASIIQQRIPWGAPIIINATANAVDAIKAIVSYQLTSWTYGTLGKDWTNVATSTATVGTDLVIEGSDSDPWEACQDLATKIGRRLYWGRDGRLVLQNPGWSRGAWDLRPGPQAVITELAQNARDFAPNFVSVRSSAPDTNIVANASRDNGPNGWKASNSRVFFYSSPLLTTQAAADLAAVTRMNNLRTSDISAQGAMVRNPGLDPFDWVRVNIPDGSGGDMYLDARTVTIPLVGGEGRITACAGDGY